MNVLIAHFSDFHFKIGLNDELIKDRAEKIRNAIISADRSAIACFIVITGDISFSGKIEEFELAMNFLDTLTSELHEELDAQLIKYAIIPGNHDCDLARPMPIRDRLLSTLSGEEIDEQILAQLTEPQNAYFDFVSCYDSALEPKSVKDRLGNVIRHEVEGYTFAFNLINTAYMSTNPEERGSLYYPLERLKSVVREARDADYVVSLMHHPFEWFARDLSKDIQRIIEKSSDFILTGHGHDVDVQILQRPATGSVIHYYEGGALFHHNDYDLSQFSIYRLGLKEQKQQILTYSWHSTEHYYKPDKTDWVEIKQNILRKLQEYTLRDQFEEYIDDIGLPLRHSYKSDLNMKDVYIQSELKKISLKDRLTNEINLEYNSISNLVMKDRYVLIYGTETSGKTTNSKVAFSELRSTGYIPLLFNGGEIKKHSEDAIKLYLEGVYDKIYDSGSFDKYLQSEKLKRLIIVDDYDQIPLNRQGTSKLLTLLERMFGTVLLFASDEFSVTQIKPINGQKPGTWKYTQYKIQPLGYSKRYELIDRWVVLGREWTLDESEAERESKRLGQIIDGMIENQYVPSTPFFILMFLSTMDVKRQIDTSSGRYGYLYEAMINKQIMEIKDREARVETIRNYLMELALLMHEGREEYIPQNEFKIWHNKYCDKYAIDLNEGKMVENLIGASILISREKIVTFKYPYVYYYFLARYINEHKAEKGIIIEIERMAGDLQNEKSANTLLFLSYLTKDPVIVDAVLKNANHFYSDITEFNILREPNLVSDGMASGPTLVLSDGTPGEHRREMMKSKDTHQEEKISMEKEFSEEAIAHYTYLNASIKTINILGQILKNHGGTIEADKKLRIVDTISKLGGRITGFAFELINESKEDLHKIFIELLKEKYPNISTLSLDRKAVLSMFHFASAITYSMIKHVTDSIGDKSLKPTFENYYSGAISIEKRFERLSIQLDHYKLFPTKESVALMNTISGNVFAEHILRLLVWTHFHLYTSVEKTRQQICSMLGIKALTPAALYKEKVKRKRQ